jgi:hypothetical protein
MVLGAMFGYICEAKIFNGRLVKRLSWGFKLEGMEIRYEYYSSVAYFFSDCSCP